MKKCCTCKSLKPVGEFSKNRSTKDGLQCQCKGCDKSYRQVNSAKIAEYQQEYRQTNSDKRVEYDREYYKANTTKITEYQKAYKQANPDKINANVAKRKANKLKATPKWLTPEEHEWIEALYFTAANFSVRSGESWNVDHIVPLQGKNVCGLHVPWNLCVIRAKDNFKKSNKF
jgi:hypothetical protein